MFIVHCRQPPDFPTGVIVGHKYFYSSRDSFHDYGQMSMLIGWVLKIYGSVHCAGFNSQDPQSTTEMCVRVTWALVCVSGYIGLLCMNTEWRPKNRLGKLLMDFGKQIKTSTERYYNNIRYICIPTL